MSRNKLGRVARTVLIATSSLVTLQCHPVPVPKDDVYALCCPTSKGWPRKAVGGGLVTVDVTVRSGPLPHWDVPPLMPDTIALLSNRGEGGKREKRYDLKPSDTATYKLVLSGDGSGRTKWTLYEQAGGYLTERRTGHLWKCDNHLPLPRWVGFHDCSLPVAYSALDTAAGGLRGQRFFASYFMPANDVMTAEDAAIWISCNSGCCSLGV